MTNIPQEVLSRLESCDVWPAISEQVTSDLGFEVNFVDPELKVVGQSDMPDENGPAQVCAQFSFASLPANSLALIFTAETLGDIVGSKRGQAPASLDESLLSDFRPVIEAVVQALCLSLGGLRSEPLVASGLTSRFQPTILPPNLARSEVAVRWRAKLQCEDFSDWVVLLMDGETAHMLTGIEPTEESAPFTTVAGGLSGSGGASGQEEHGLEIIMDIPLEVSVELGRVKMPVRDVVELGAGSIVEIDKAAGEPVDVLVNGRLVARGEVVVIDENFGVRITEILSVQERLSKLNEVA